MSKIIRAIIQNSLHQNKNREEVKNREIRYLPDLSISNLLSVFVCFAYIYFTLHLFIFILLSVFVLVQRILNYYTNYPTHRLYFGEVETSYFFYQLFLIFDTCGVCPVFLVALTQSVQEIEPCVK